jgi:histidine triad (HIT) family protein
LPKIAENADYLAFLDINPINLGHTLVIPKEEVDYVFDLDDECFQGLMAFTKPVAMAIKQALSCQRVGMIVAGYEIPHAHVHLIPTNSMTDLSFSQARSASNDQLATVAEKIRKQLITR